MIADRCDARPRIYITANRDGVTAHWSLHPAAVPQFARSAGEAVDAAIAGLGGAAAVIIWSGRQAPPG